MGNEQSNTINQTVDVVNESLVSVMSSTSNTAGQVVASNQTINLTVTGELSCGGDLNIIQTNKTVANLESVFQSSNFSQLSTMMENALDTAASSNNKSVTGFLSTAVANSQNNTTSISQHIKNTVKQNISNIVSNSCTQSVSTVQEQNLVFPGKVRIGGDCNFGQNIQLELAAKCMASAVQEAIAQDAVLNEAISTAAATNDSVATGPISELFAGLAGLWGALLLPIIVIALVGGAVVIMRLSGKAKRAAGRQARREGRRAGAAAAPSASSVASAAAPYVPDAAAGYYQQMSQ